MNVNLSVGIEQFGVKDSDTMISEKQFIEFKKRYEEFEKQQKLEVLERFKKDFHRFSNSYRVINELVGEFNRKEALEFNVFAILGRGHLEVLTHTPFLAELLDPRGTHGQKGLFLRCFLMRILGYTEAEASDQNWFITKESEHVDLRILNYSLRKAIYIENKIYTDAHSGQLSRYYLLWQTSSFKGSGAFIYLTPDGKEPDDAGFDDKISTKSEIMKCLFLLSYKNDICNWLKESILQVESSRVRETINQYIDLIKKL